MLFTRLVVAALSLGSIAQVFAAPVIAGIAGNKVVLSPRTPGSPFAFLDQGIATLTPLKDQLGESAEYLPQALSADAPA